MNSVAVQQKRFLRLTPSNNSSSGYSPVSSQPIIRFSVADTQALALLKDARLNFRLKVTKTGASTPVALTDDFNVDPVVGLCGVSDQIIISSRRYGTQLEQVTNLGRLESSFYRSSYSPKMMSSCVYHGNKSVGLGRYNGYDGGARMASLTTDLRSIAMRKSLITAQTTDPKDDGFTQVSIPFHAGMFLTDEPMDLSVIGGIELAIFLKKPDDLFNGAAVAADSNYTLFDVSLTLPVVYKSAAQIQQTPAENVVEFLNWTSLYSVLDSTASSIAYRLQLSGLVSAIHNMLPTAQINNPAQNGFALKSPDVQRLTFLKDGVRSPLEKTTVVEEDRTAVITNKATKYPEVLQDYLSAWLPNKDMKYTQVIGENVSGVVNRNGVYGIGCNYSPTSGGINVSGVIGIDILSKLEDITTPNTAQTEPYALFSYFLSRQAFATMPSGIRAL